jgi:hypothetical protein
MKLQTIIVDGKTVTLAGHGGIPGTGPKGETCGSCQHIVKLCSKSVLKCGLNRAKWTSGRKSDVLQRDPACSKWEKNIRG